MTPTPGEHFNSSPRTIKKFWGQEHILISDQYTCKIMELNPGFSVSLHWHCKKEEIFLLISGEMIVDLINQAGELRTIKLTKPFSSVAISKNTPHRFYCPDKQKDKTIFIEASTQDDPNDSYRFHPSCRTTELINYRRFTD